MRQTRHETRVKSEEMPEVTGWGAERLRLHEVEGAEVWAGMWEDEASVLLIFKS